MPPPANYKRLIVLCDGTWQNILSGDSRARPTNVARFARAIAPVAIIKDDKGTDREVEQVVYYQPGVGTGFGDLVGGGLYGAGLSANVRAAYGFLAHNYDPNPGDEIFFFGFSRGAYTARSIAGLVTQLGLLTKKGMDYFPEVYAEYYKDPANNPDFEFSNDLKKKIGMDINKGAQDAVRIVGVWDTVGYHAEGRDGEKIELHNTVLSTRVGYGFHALSMDERREPFIPTLWQWPQATSGGGGSKAYEPRKDGKGLQGMKQVWFSGEHSDVGGGKYDPILSDIALAWMLAQCSDKDKKLAFTDENPRVPNDPNDVYLLRDRTKNTITDWKGLVKPSTQDKSQSWAQAIKNRLTELGQRVIMKEVDREALTEDHTRERIHRSIAGRDLKAWPCPLLADAKSNPTPKGTWKLKTKGDFGDALAVLEPDPVADAIEDKYRGRIRAPPGSKGGPSL